MKKAQIFTLDVMISLALVVLALGSIIHSFELKEYTLKEEELYSELKNKIEIASLMLSINENVICEVQNTKIRMQNCIAENNPNLLNLKELLGLSNEFGCRLENTAKQTIGNCNESIPNNESIISIKKKLLLLENNPTKSEWNTCINGKSVYTFEDFTLSIWRT